LCALATRADSAQRALLQVPQKLAQLSQARELLARLARVPMIARSRRAALRELARPA